jgi:hypothetical protein
MLCPTCGRDNPSNALFCGHCGQPQASVSQAPPVNAPRSAADGISDVRMLTARLVELGSQVMNPSTRRHGIAKDYLRQELRHLVLYFAGLDGRISQREAQVYTDISDSMEDTGMIDNVAGFLSGSVDWSISTGSPFTLERPLLLDVIEEDDVAHKTNNAAEARTAFFKIASSVAWADGSPTDAASSELDRYKQLLEPRANACDTSAVLEAPAQFEGGV